MTDKSLLTRGGAGPAGLPTGEVPITVDGVEVVISVRAMNRGEMLMAGKIHEEKGQLEMERYVLSSCMLDPTMAQEDVDAWYASGAAMEAQPVCHKINALSGVGKDAAKSGVLGDGDES